MNSNAVLLNKNVRKSAKLKFATVGIKGEEGEKGFAG